MHGSATSAVEATNVGPRGLCLLLGDEELRLPFADFPWFRKATIKQIADVQRPTENHLCWPQLDVDLSVQSIREPAAFPLVSKQTD